ncbi:hypothetical protein BOW39_02350 [Solemya velum gill symbiont]|nr:hypothetical protein BOW39_02350 [Solemya velum gill symbiont]OOZ59049.1 hypothetical protein BOW44_12530 [Solemya velum gill symbiont]OOZ59559.1 hypothetical protein BOW43_05250 [Solemya velum gill symbiont]OOZ69097.1 hypothetical protein BOW47_06495 [Solemya velum gill symbiont]
MKLRLLSESKLWIKRFIPNYVLDWITVLKYKKNRAREYGIYKEYVGGGNGLEIGGPSSVFLTVLPIYSVIKSLDNLSFSENTNWNSAKSGHTYKYFGNKKGYQYISDATNLSHIKSNTYDFVLSSNCLEHIANPMKALFEWKRVLCNDGVLVLVLPRKDNNFDHKREYTTFNHILSDYRNNMLENDLTHFDEIMALHDLSLDRRAGDLSSFKKRSLDNYYNRTLHHHVFNEGLINDMLNYTEFYVVNIFMTKVDIFALAVSVTNGIKREQCP